MTAQIQASTRPRLNLARYAFLAVVALVYLLTLAPVISVIVISVFNAEIVSFPPDGLTLRWFVNAWEKREFARGFVASLQLALLATAIGVPIGTMAAFALDRSAMRGKGLIANLLLGPLVVPGIIIGTALYMFYVQVENTIDQDVVGTTFGLVASHILLTIPWTVRLVSAGLAGVDSRIEEAAANLGARPLTVFFRVTLPTLRPAIVAATMFSFIQSFENLELSLLLVGPGQTTLPVAMLNYLQFRIDPTLAAVGTIQIVVIAILMLITDRFVKLSRVV
tara:strand:+ start:2086 stop:2922 length:837 start_codon:yes stop_codon:yes gene_type:complete